MKFINLINNFSIYDLKYNDDNVKIFPNKPKHVCEKLLELIINKNPNLIKKYYKSLEKYNAGVLDKDIIEYSGYKLWKKTIENLYFSIDIIEYIKKKGLKNLNIVEIGCGFGDIYIILNMMSDHYDIKFKYTIIDLDDWIKVIKTYFEKMNQNIDNLNFVNYSDITNNTYNIKKYDLCISKYAYSELNGHIRQLYINTIISNTLYNYIIWNYPWSACKEHGIDKYFIDTCNKVDISEKFNNECKEYIVNFSNNNIWNETQDLVTTM